MEPALLLRVFVTPTQINITKAGSISRGQMRDNWGQQERFNKGGLEPVTCNEVSPARRRRSQYAQEGSQCVAKSCLSGGFLRSKLCPTGTLRYRGVPEAVRWAASPTCSTCRLVVAQARSPDRGIWRWFQGQRRPAFPKGRGDS
ncbi:hypothetical protein DP117_36055 [Brasilonema sp. UFV-L1]|nr:hypothetical protein [Brasilonema sp. UFV-L1]